MQPDLIEQQARSVNRPVVVELDRSLQVLQRLHWTIEALFANRIVEPGRGVLRVQSLATANCSLREPIALLFIVCLTQIAADKRVVGVKTRSKLNFPAAPLQISLWIWARPRPSAAEDRLDPARLPW